MFSILEQVEQGDSTILTSTNPGYTNWKSKHDEIDVYIPYASFTPGLYTVTVNSQMWTSVMIHNYFSQMEEFISTSSSDSSEQVFYNIYLSPAFYLTAQSGDYQIELKPQAEVVDYNSDQVVNGVYQANTNLDNGLYQATVNDGMIKYFPADEENARFEKIADGDMIDVNTGDIFIIEGQAQLIKE